MLFNPDIFLKVEALFFFPAAQLGKQPIVFLRQLSGADDDFPHSTQGVGAFWRKLASFPGSAG